MSETTETQQAEAEYVPQDVLQNEDEAPEQQQDTEDTKPEKPEADDAEERLRKERRAYAQRLGQQTRLRYEAKARADALEQQLQQYEQRLAQLEGRQPQGPNQDLDQEVNRRAAQMLAQQQHNERVNTWDKAGKEEFGVDKFDSACKTVADMASAEQRGMLLAIAMDVDGGQKAIMEMADNPEEAERILSMPPHRMALAIEKLGAAQAAPAPKPVSNLPPPIRPPAVGRARGEPDPERGSMEDYKRWSAKQQWSRY